MPTIPENLQTALTNIAIALAAGDLLTPKSYSLDGESYTRDDLVARFTELQKLINQQTPWIISTRQVL